MTDTLSGNTISFNALQLLKAPSPISVMVEGRLTSVKEEQPKNISEETASRESGKCMDWRLSQS